MALVFLSRCSPFTICDEAEISQYCALMPHLETPLGPIWVDKAYLRQGCGLGLLSPPIELAIDPLRIITVVYLRFLHIHVSNFRNNTAVSKWLHGSMSDDECPALPGLPNQPSNSNDHIELHFQGVFNIHNLRNWLLFRFATSYNLDTYSRPCLQARITRCLGNLIRVEGENGASYLSRQKYPVKII